MADPDPSGDDADQEDPWTGPAGSFRDPQGKVVLLDDRVLRLVHPEAVDEVRELLSTPAMVEMEAEGRIVGTSVLESDDQARALSELSEASDASQVPGHDVDDEALVLEHERIPFPSYPHEWPAEMLHAAGALTLDLSLEIVDEGLGLKDATPSNVMFRGPEPVLIDVLSVEERDPHNPTWLPSAQFIRTFLLPLFLHDDLGLSPHNLLLTRRDGVEPGEAYNMLGWAQRLLPPYLTLVSLPRWLSGERGENLLDRGRDRREEDPEKATFVYERQIKGLAKKLEKARPNPADQRSHWEDYMTTSQYDAEALEAKRTFVREAVAAGDPDWVLDIGCNTGAFSAVAAREGASVVAVDADPAVVGRTWQRATDQDLDVLPLVVDISRPTPPVGWANMEAPSFLDRARDRFDTVLMLALVHHLMVTERVPLNRIFELAAYVSREHVVVEHVGVEDPMFQRISRGREHLFEGHSRKTFEQAFQPWFLAVDDAPVPGLDRHLYHLTLDGDAGPGGR